MNLDQEPDPDCDVVLNHDTASVASDPDWDVMLDPDPASMNPDPKHWPQRDKTSWLHWTKHTAHTGTHTSDSHVTALARWRRWRIQIRETMSIIHNGGDSCAWTQINSPNRLMNACVNHCRWISLRQHKQELRRIETFWNEIVNIK